MIPIDKNVPFPIGPSTGKRSTWPFALMEPQTSFVVPPESVDALRVAAYAYGRRHGMTFAVRRGADGVTRCWRTDGARADGATVATGRRVIRSVGAKPVRQVDDVRVFVDMHGDEFVPLEDLLNATLKTGDTRFALDKLAGIAEIHPEGAQRALYAAQLGQIRGALVGDSAESIANGLEPPQASFPLLDDADDPV